LRGGAGFAELVKAEEGSTRGLQSKDAAEDQDSAKTVVKFRVARDALSGLRK
jgi:hypothetical protein